MRLVRYEVLEDPHGWGEPAFTLADRDDGRRPRSAVHSLFLDRCDKAAGDLVPLTDDELAALTARRNAAHREATQTSLEMHRRDHRKQTHPDEGVSE